MKQIIKYLRKMIPHNSPLRLWYTRVLQVAAYVLVPINLQKIKLIGVTGTDGKTTTVEMVAHILGELNIDYISTTSLEVKISGNTITASKRTTPSLWQLRKLLKKAKTKDVGVAVIEVSSHALAQWRVFGIKFDTAVLTNITHEHLNFHKTRARYAAAKKLLFTRHLKREGVAILPTSDEYGSKWLTELAHTTGYTNPESTTTHTGTEFIYNDINYTIPMLGSYNTGNAVAAALAVESLGLEISLPKALAALSTFAGIPGRMQVIPSCDLGIVAIVDFALTERAMNSALHTAREIAGDNKVIVIFGATGGQHDTTVRPGLARAAANNADIVVITDDEPYSSDPAEIRADLINSLQQADTNCEYHNIENRRNAIKFALSKVNRGDVVILTGMGHYTSRTVDGHEEPWSDELALTEELHKLAT